MELKGKTAIVSGSSGGLGGSIARVLAENGCNCVCHYHSEKLKADKLVEQMKNLGVKAMSVGGDLSRPEEIEILFEKAAELGTAQILINSAAIFSAQPLEEVTFEDAQKVITMNLISPIMMSRTFAKRIKSTFPESKTAVGKIINMADVGGVRPWAGYVVYCSSKAGLIGATKALAKELSPAICVNSVAPGMVSWPSNFSEAEKKRQLSLIPAGRIGEPGEVTEAVITLLKNDYITGQVLNVDGGRCI